MRLDYQLSPKSRADVERQPDEALAAVRRSAAPTIPAATGTTDEYTDAARRPVDARARQPSALNEIKLGYAGFGFKNANLTTWSHHWRAADGINTGSPRITFTGFSIAGNANYPRYQLQDV